MSILIKGMEMPERCWDCDLCYDSFYCRPLEIQFSDREDFEPGERRLSDCPLVHVPPHRLIDADELKVKVIEVLDAYSARMIEMLDQRRTIIEVEDEDGYI